jgi:hypothetical protein
MTIMDEYRERAVQAYAKAMDAEFRRMLGLWVSELEPSAIYDQGGRLLGLSAVGHGRRIYVPALEPWEWRL